MKQTIFSVGLIGLMIASAACSKKAAVTTPPPAPAAAPPAAAAPAPAKAVAAKPAPAPTAPKQLVQAPQPRTTPTPAERASLNASLARLEDALFDYDKSTIRSDASVALKDDVTVIRDILTNYPSQKLLIEGHADERGSQEYNLALGDRRAHAVQEFLVSMGVPNNQLELISYGKEHPVCTEQTEDCWQRNRRAHLTAAAQ